MHSSRTEIDSRTSENFYTVKVVAVFVVVTGHFFKEAVPLLWVPTTLTMLVFAYASAYFTRLIYGYHFNRRVYWVRKFQRLGLSLLVVDIALLLFFLAKGRQGILTWQTPLNMLGLQGFLDWFQIGNPSPFGAGMWFFTLLLIFYALYPWLVRLFEADGLSVACCVIWLTASFWLHLHVAYGHALWLTTCGFLVGMFFARTHPRVPRVLSGTSFLILLIVAGGLNYLGAKILNFWLFLGMFVTCVLWLHSSNLPVFLHRTFRPFQECLLEIYLIHSYLFILPTRSLLLNFIASLILIGVTAKLLELVARRLKRSLQMTKVETAWEINRMQQDKR